MGSSITTNCLGTDQSENRWSSGPMQNDDGEIYWYTVIAVDWEHADVSG